MACEEQRNRITKLRQEIEKATSEDSKSTLQQQIGKEMAILDEREFCVISFFGFSFSVTEAPIHQDLSFKYGSSRIHALSLI